MNQSIPQNPNYKPSFSTRIVNLCLKAGINDKKQLARLMDIPYRRINELLDESRRDPEQWFQDMFEKNLKEKLEQYEDNKELDF